MKALIFLFIQAVMSVFLSNVSDPLFQPVQMGAISLIAV